MPPGDTVGEPGVSVMAKSADVTVTLVVAVLLAGVGSVVVDELTVTELDITVLPGVAALTATVKMKVLVPPLARVVLSVQVTLPVPPTAGVVQFQVPTPVRETNVVFVGVACTHVGIAAPLGPLFVTTMV